MTTSFAMDAADSLTLDAPAGATDPLLATRLTFIRHGQTDWNHGGRIQGHLDIPLNALGLQQAQCMGAALADSGIDAIYSSDLARAWDTAKALQAHTQIPLIAEQGLRERSFGRLQGQTLEEMFAQDPVLATAFQTRDPQYQPPEGESMLEFRKRVLDTVYRLARQHPGEHIAIVAHGGVLDMVYRDAVGLDLQAQRSWTIDNTSVHRLLWASEGLRLLAWGDVSHLAELAAMHANSGAADVMQKNYL